MVVYQRSGAAEGVVQVLPELAVGETGRGGAAEVRQELLVEGSCLVERGT